MALVELAVGASAERLGLEAGLRLPANLEETRPRTVAFARAPLPMDQSAPPIAKNHTSTDRSTWTTSAVWKRSMPGTIFWR